MSHSRNTLNFIENFRENISGAPARASRARSGAPSTSFLFVSIITYIP